MILHHQIKIEMIWIDLGLIIEPCLRRSLFEMMQSREVSDNMMNGIHYADLLYDQSLSLCRNWRPLPLKINVEDSILQLLSSRSLRFYDKFYEDAFFVHDTSLILVSV